LRTTLGPPTAPETPIHVQGYLARGRRFVMSEIPLYGCLGLFKGFLILKLTGSEIVLE
jgi:hypothetical protein